MASFQSMFGPGWVKVGSESPSCVMVASVPKVASLYHLKVEDLMEVDTVEGCMMMDVDTVDESMFVGHRKLDLTRKASCLGSSAMTVDEPPMKRRKHRGTGWGQELRDKHEAAKHMARLNVTIRHFASLANLPEEQLFSLPIFKGFQGPKFRRPRDGKPENLSSPWEANYQSSERYEEDLSLLLQDFEAKSKHVFALKGKWPSREAELAALFLTSKLSGKEWRKVKTNGTYLQNLDNAWRAKINNFHEEKLFQAVWEYVTGMMRDWDKQRHQACYQVKSGVLLKQRIPSMKRKQQFIDVDEWARVKRHTGVDIDRWPNRRPSSDEIEKYRR